MSYKDVLLKRVRDAQVWLENTPDKQIVEMDQKEIDNLIMAVIDVDIFDDCRFMDTFRNIKADPILAELTIKCDRDNRLFKALRLEDESKKAYEKSVKDFRGQVAFVQKASMALIEVDIPLRPKDSIYQVMDLMRSRGYSRDDMWEVMHDLNPVAANLSRKTDVIKALDEEHDNKLEDLYKEYPHLKDIY